VERGPPLGCHLAHVDHGLGVVGVHMKDGRVDHAGHVGGVRRGARHAGVRGEADLVVGHHVHGAMRGVGRQVGQVECLVHDPLARERRVPVDQDGHHLERRGGGPRSGPGEDLIQDQVGGQEPLTRLPSLSPQ